MSGLSHVYLGPKMYFLGYSGSGHQHSSSSDMHSSLKVFALVLITIFINRALPRIFWASWKKTHPLLSPHGIVLFLFVPFNFPKSCFWVCKHPKHYGIGEKGISVGYGVEGGVLSWRKLHLTWFIKGGYLHSFLTVEMM